MDKRTRKLMTKHITICSRDPMDIFYVSRSENRRRLANIEDCVDALIRGIEEYIYSDGDLSLLL